MIAFLWRLVVGSCWGHQWETMATVPMIDRAWDDAGRRVGTKVHLRCTKCGLWAAKRL